MWALVRVTLELMSGPIKQVFALYLCLRPFDRIYSQAL